MVLSAVQHICCVDELIARSSNPQLGLSVAEHYLPPGGEERTVNVSEELATSTFSASCYFASQASGVKSNLCLVLKIMFLVLISRMDGGCRGVAMANRAS